LPAMQCEALPKMAALLLPEGRTDLIAGTRSYSVLTVQFATLPVAHETVRPMAVRSPAQFVRLRAILYRSAQKALSCTTSLSYPDRLHFPNPRGDHSLNLD
jgi:hypothetical protein